MMTPRLKALTGPMRPHLVINRWANIGGLVAPAARQVLPDGFLGSTVERVQPEDARTSGMPDLQDRPSSALPHHRVPTARG